MLKGALNEKVNMEIERLRDDWKVGPWKEKSLAWRVFGGKA